MLAVLTFGLLLWCVKRIHFVSALSNLSINPSCHLSLEQEGATFGAIKLMRGLQEVNANIYICKNEDVGFADPISDYRHASTSKVVTRRSSHFFPFQLQAFMTTSAIWTRWPLRSICLCELRLSVPLERLGAALAAAAPSVLRAVVRGSCGACTSSTFARLRPPAPDFDPYLNFKLKMYLGQTIQQFMAKEVLNLRCAL